MTFLLNYSKVYNMNTFLILFYKIKNIEMQKSKYAFFHYMRKLENNPKRY